VTRIIAEELNIPLEAVRKSSLDSRILLGDTKSAGVSV